MLSSFTDYAIKFVKNRYYLLSSILVFLSFPSYDSAPFKLFPFFAWFCLVPMMYYVRISELRKGYVASFITFLLSSIFTFGWMGQFGKGAEGGSAIILVFLMPCISFLWSGRLLAAEYLSRKNEKFRFLIYPSVWIFFDLLQSIGYLAFPWTFLGYTQYPVLPMIQIASLAGVNGVTFLIISVNTSATGALVAFRRKIRLTEKSVLIPAVISLSLVSVSLLYGGIRLLSDENSTGRKLTIAMVQSCISPWDNWEMKKMSNLAELMRISDKALESKPDFLIWSESATLEPISYRVSRGTPALFDSALISYIKEKKVPLLTGEIGVIRNVKGYYLPQNNTVLFGPDGNIIKTYSKIHLAPFGEWFPYERILPWIADLALSLGGTSFVPGDKMDLFEIKGLTFGMLICYEGMFFRLNREYTRMGADFLLNITNDGWSKSYGGHFQHFSAGRFRAVENGIWFVRAGNTGFTTLIDPKGRLKGSIPILNKGYLIADINTGEKVKTLYTRVGDLFTYILILFTILAGGWGIFRNRKMENK